MASQGEDVKKWQSSIIKGSGQILGPNGPVLPLDYEDVSIGLYICQNLPHCTLCVYCMSSIR